MKKLVDRNGVELKPGDLVRVGMRVGDSNGWTVERVEYDIFGEMHALRDPETGEWMDYPKDSRLIEKMTPEIESIWRLSARTNVRRCPHDGAWCYHSCGRDTGPEYCYRKDCGQELEEPHEGYPL